MKGQRSVWAALVVCVLLALQGCGGDDGGTETVTVTQFPDPEPIASIVADFGGRQVGQEGVIEIPFVLRDFGGDAGSDQTPAANVTVEFSTDSGSFEQATGGADQANPATLETSRSGRTHTFLWDAAADLDRPRNVQIRVTPQSEAGLGVSATTSTFLALNDAPVIRDAEVSLLGSGLLRLDFVLSDSTEDAANVTMEIVDGVNDRDVLVGEPNLINSSLNGLATSRAGTAHSVVWDFSGDVSALGDTFQIALTPADAQAATGERLTVGPFAKPVVDDGGNARESILPLSPAPGSILRAADGSVQLDFVLVGPDDGTASVRLEYLIDGESRRMRIEDVISHDEPEAMGLELASLATSGDGRGYTALWDMGSDIGNDRPEVDLRFVVVRQLQDGAEDVEAIVPVQVDGNENPTVTLEPIDAITTDPADIRVEINDPESNLVSLDVQVSFDGGESFRPATINAQTPVVNMPSNVGSQLFRWDVTTDLQEAFGGPLPVDHAVMRIGFNDNPQSELAIGEPVFSGPFSINVAQDIDQEASTVEVSAPTALANLEDGVEITVTLVDVEGNRLPGQLVALAVTGQGNVLSPPLGATDINGVFTTTLRSERAEVKDIIAQINPGESQTVLENQGQVTFLGDPDQINRDSTLVDVTPRVALPADAVSAYTIDVVVRDVQDNPIAGVEVLATSETPGAGIGVPSRVTDLQGNARFQVTSTAVGEVVLDLIIDPEGVARVLSGAARLRFIAGPAARLRYIEAPQEFQAGSPTPLVVGFEDEFGNVLEGLGAGEISLELASGPEDGQLLGTTVVDAVGGQGVFATSINRVGTYTLRATSEGLTSVISEPITVTAGPPVQLLFAVQPIDSTVAAANSSDITVVAVDGFGNAAADFEQEITLSLGNNPTGATISGTTPTAIINGSARFNLVTIAQAGAGYTLIARANGIAPAESDPFDVGLFVPRQPRLIGPGPIDSALADLNNDGVMDLAVANVEEVGGAVGTFVGDGDGDFNNSGVQLLGVSPVALELANLTGDGVPDVVVASYDPNQDRTLMQVYTSDGQGGFANINSRSTGGQPNAMASGQLDEDGVVDFVVTLGGGALAIFRGSSAGTVRDAVLQPIAGAIELTGVAVADLNGDDINDIVVLDQVAPSEGRLWILDGQGALSFAQPRQLRVGPGPVALDIGDFNGDDLLDIVTANARTTTLLANIGGGDFVSLDDLELGGGPSDIVLADVDGNRTLDIAVTLQDADAVALLVGNGFGGFTFISPTDTEDEPTSVSVADVNGDLKADLVVTNRGSNSASVLLNAVP